MRLSHAYITDKALSDNLAMTAVCSSPGEGPCLSCAHCKKASRGIHPDITVVKLLPDKREIVVDQIREIKKDVIIVPCESQKKVYIVLEADLMNTNAQNAFLQVLEEPPAHVVFILQTDNPAQLLPTVRSRCIELKSLRSPETADSAVTSIVNEFYDSLEMGNYALTALMFRLEKLEKGVFTEFLTMARTQVSFRIIDDSGSKKFKKSRAERLSRCERLLARAGEMLDLNVNIGHISGMICAGLMDSADRG